MKASELAAILLQHPEADVVITFHENYSDGEVETFSCTINSVDESWLPEVLSVEGSIVISA